ncbi:hypothetical protein [Agrobacterium tumefaciens]|uniref:hypothetical protein n=1 Tax=Agrobacterium tumefaciens TaxID=358 RepID=UPI00045A7D13|nr:hypothetical protein [Agrobacterium tumefaciens]CDN96053.1 hypothetical protein BN949_05227 [Agrobacterium tumefaciens]
MIDRSTEPHFVKTEDIEVAPGVRIGDLQDVDACREAVARLEYEIGSISSQIARAEEDPASVLPGWRTRAQNAQRWKKRAIKAINVRASEFGKQEVKPAPAHKNECREAILKVIREDIGEAAMEAYVATAKRRYPELFTPVDKSNNGENDG